MNGPASEASGVSPRPAQTATSIILGSLAILIFGIQPLLYAAFVGEDLIEPDRLGLLSAAEVIAIAIGSSLAIPALKYASVRAIAGLAILIVAAANYFQTLYGSADMLFAFRMIAGLGSGFLVGIAGMAIAATSRVGQWAAAYLLAQATSQFLHLQCFALFWPAPTSKELLLSLTIAAAAMLAGLPFLPRRLGAGTATQTETEAETEAETGSDQGAAKPDAMGIRWLAVMFLFVGGVLTIWAYAGVWLESENVSAASAATILSASLAGQAMGAFAACLIPSSRHDRLRLTATTLLLLLSAGAWFAWPGSAFAAAGFGIWWLSSVPILSSILSDADPRRAALPYAPAAQLSGIAIIPTIAGFLFAARDVELVLVSGCAAIALGLLLGFARQPRWIAAWFKEVLRGAGGGR